MLPDITHPKTPQNAERRANGEQPLIIQYIVDLGTTTVSAGAQVLREGSLPITHHAHLLMLQEETGRVDVPLKMGFYREGSDWSFIWGHEVNERLNRSPPGSSDVVGFEWLKSCLLGSEGAEERQRTIETRLRQIKGKDKSIDWLLRRYLESLRNAIIMAARKKYRQYEIDNMRSEWFFAVPEVATPTYIRQVTKAAKAAGFPDPIPVSETEAAAGWGVHIYMREQGAYAPLIAELTV